MNRHIGTIRQRVQVNLIFEPRDLWIGLFRGKSYWEMGTLWTPLYVCPIPMLAILLTVKRQPRRDHDDA
jgi:hypothetical protein